MIYIFIYKHISTYIFRLYVHFTFTWTYTYINHLYMCGYIFQRVSQKRYSPPFLPSIVCSLMEFFQRNQGWTLQEKATDDTEIVHHYGWRWSHHSQGFIHLRWCGIPEPSTVLLLLKHPKPAASSNCYHGNLRVPPPKANPPLIRPY